MSVLAAMCKLLASAPGAPFGSDDPASNNRRIYAPLILAKSKLPAYGFARFEGLQIETFGYTQEQPRIQLMVRSDGANHDAAERKMEAAKAWLQDQHDLDLTVDVDGQTVHVLIGYIRSTSGILYLGKNESGDHEWSTNFEVTYG